MHRLKSRLFLAALVATLAVAASSAGEPAARGQATGSHASANPCQAPTCPADHCPAYGCPAEYCDREAETCDDECCSEECQSPCNPGSCSGQARCQGSCGKNSCGTARTPHQGKGKGAGACSSAGVCGQDSCCRQDCCDDDGCGETGCDENCCTEDGCGAGGCCQGKCDDDGGCNTAGGCCGIWFSGPAWCPWKNFAYGKRAACGKKCESFGISFGFLPQGGFPIGKLYGQAAQANQAAARNTAPAPRFGVFQAGANACACQCGCEKCRCGKNDTAFCPAGATAPVKGQGGCPFGACQGPRAKHLGVVFISPPGCGPGVGSAGGPGGPPPHCPVIGPHGEVLHKLGALMAENAALKARLEVQKECAGEHDALRAALTEARQEVARLSATQGGARDQALVEWIKAQAEASARKDEMLIELFGAVVEMQGTNHTATANGAATAACEVLEGKIEKLEAALRQAQEENARLRVKAGQQRDGKRVSTPVEPTSCPARNRDDRPAASRRRNNTASEAAQY